MAESGWPRFAPVADHALLVSFAETITDEAGSAVLALDAELTRSPPEGMVECVPAYVSLLVDFDPLLTDHGRVREAAERLWRIASSRPAQPAAQAPVHEVEVCYDGELAPDLAAVALASRLTVEA